MSKRLSESEIEAALRKLEGWRREGKAIKRSLKFGSFKGAIDFINRIARHADEADHHPEIFNVYDNVDLVLTTHDADGLTGKDFDLAEKIDGEV
ncbi:MAG: 4a-hydroxytetrahydrobiopterin dehydratase [Bradymonadaceae bacterium]